MARGTIGICIVEKFRSTVLDLTFPWKNQTLCLKFHEKYAISRSLVWFLVCFTLSYRQLISCKLLLLLLLLYSVILWEMGGKRLGKYLSISAPVWWELSRITCNVASFLPTILLRKWPVYNQQFSYVYGQFVINYFLCKVLYHLWDDVN